MVTRGNMNNVLHQLLIRENKMKTLRIISAAALASFIASSALAASGDVYARMDAGYALGQAKFTGSAQQNVIINGFAGNLGLGYCITDEIRTDVNFGFTPAHSIKIKNSTLAGNNLRMSSSTAMLNGYYDFTGAEIIPYVTLGAGMLNVKGKVTGPNAATFKRKTAFAYQAGFGASFELSSKVHFDLGYRFTGNSVGKSTTGALSFKPAKFAHTFLFGTRISF